MQSIYENPSLKRSHLFELMLKALKLICFYMFPVNAGDFHLQIFSVSVI